MNRDLYSIHISLRRACRSYLHEELLSIVMASLEPNILRKKPSQAIKDLKEFYPEEIAFISQLQSLTDELSKLANKESKSSLLNNL